MKLLEEWYPLCHKYGMSEEQFWKSNPRIIKIWEQIYKNELNEKNSLIHSWVGNYVMSAVYTSLSQILVPMFSKGHSSAKYTEEPIRLFPKTEEEKKAEYEQMTQTFINWGNSLVKKYKKPDK